MSASEKKELRSAARLVSEQRQKSHSIAVTGKQHFEIQSTCPEGYSMIQDNIFENSREIL